MLSNNIAMYFIVSLLIAIAAFVYSYLLVQPGEILSGLFKRLDILFKTDQRQAAGLGAHPFFKMIMRCEKCVAGQLSNLVYFIFAWPYYRSGHLILIIGHLLFITLTIFLTILVKKFYKTYIE